MKQLLVFFSLLVILGCKNTNDHKRVTFSQLQLEELTIADIHAAYQAGEYTAQDLVSAYLKRINTKDGPINAITFRNPDALTIAKQLDSEFLETGKLRPLHGIPIIVKDNYNTKGMPTTAGALALNDFKPTSNATIVQKLLYDGAIVIAKSNMAEWAFSPKHTESSTAGTTKNPYNTLYVPAGSSGGTAAAIAANFGVIGLGTDTGNSIRGPSSHTALVGFRTTMGLTSRSGIVPLYLRNDIGGPMCRTVADATKVLNSIAGYDPTDSITLHGQDKTDNDYTRYLVKNGLEGAKLGVLRSLSEHQTDPEIKNLFNKALGDLRNLGATIIDSVEIPNFNELRKNQWCNAFKVDVEQYLAEFVDNDTLKTIEDIARIDSKSDYARDAVVYFRDNAIGRASAPGIPCKNVYEDARSITFRNAIEKKMDELGVDALLYPTWNNKPARIKYFEEEYKGDNSQIIAPHTGQPAFTVPMGLTKDGLPTGLQFLGRMFAEPTLIKLTYAYEQNTKHRTKPTL